MTRQARRETASSSAGETLPLATQQRPAGGWIVGIAVVLAGTVAWGAVLQAVGTDLTLFAAPFFADWGPRLGWGIVIPLVIALVIVTCGPLAASVLPWRRLLLIAWITTVAWSVALAASTGWDGLTRSLRSRFDYAAALPAVRPIGLGPYIRTYVSRLDDAPIHVKSHPPGMVTFLRGLEVIGLRGSGWAAAVLIAVTATVPLAVAITVRRLGGEAPARAVLPFLVCGPWTLLVATVADGVFAATVAWGVALLAVAATDVDRRAASGVGVIAGGVLSGSLYLSYGLVPLVLALAGAVLVSTRRFQLIVPAAVGAVAVAAAWTLAGFQWLQGFNAAMGFYGAGAAAERPYSYFVVANLVVLAVMLGPAVVAGWARGPRHTTAARHGAARSPGPSDALVPALRWLAGASLLAVAVADLSGLSKGEVERIWLPFMPFATLVVVRLGSGRRATPWIAAQAAVAITLQTVLVWPW